MNKANIDRIKNFPWHPYLLAIFPTLALLSYNIGEIKMGEALRALLVSLAAAILLTVILRLIVKDMHKAAAISSFILVLFFSYGHIYNILEANSLAGVSYRTAPNFSPTLPGDLRDWCVVDHPA